MTQPSLKIGMIQTRVGLDKAANVEKTSLAIRDAAARGATLICLQELFASQYFCQTEDASFFDLAEPIDGATVQAIAKVAKECKVSVVTPIFEKRAPGIYHNSVVVVGPQGNTIGLYRKMHIPDDPLFMEKYYFTPGDLGFQSFDTPDAKVGTLICWDQWYPEAARLTAMRGAEVLTYPTAIGWHPSEKEQYGAAQVSAWQTMQRSHAIANGCYVCVPNRIGHEIIKDTKGKPVDKDGIVFWGQSFVASPDGQVVKRAPINKETVLVVDCDLAKVEFSRTHWPFLRDRRIDAYGALTKRFSD